MKSIDMADGRKNNGGNSTKAKGIDRRKNQYRTALSKASTVEDVVKVIQKVKGEAIKGDLQACKLFLAYYLGNPKDTIDNNVSIKNALDITKLYDKKAQ